jgi:putative aminopeptidase FrvX
MPAADATVNLELLQSLCATPAVSGQEAAIRAEIERHVSSFAAVEHDALGNVWASVGGSQPPHVAMVSHADQIGFIVSDVDDRGFVLFEAVGDAFADGLPGRELIINAGDEVVHGVVGRTTRCLTPESDWDKVPPVRDHWLDIGAADRDEALSHVRVGDAITFPPCFLSLRNGLCASPALDDRSGLYAVLRALDLWHVARQAGTTAEPKSGLHLTAVATAREETGFTGARRLARTLECDVAIIVDVIFASDDPGVSPKSAGGRLRLGGGPVLARGAASAPHLVALAESAAQAKGIPYQLRAAPGRAGTDADELLTAANCAVLSISIPLRYMHSALEVAALSDIEATAQLVTEIVGLLDRE